LIGPVDASDHERSRVKVLEFLWRHRYNGICLMVQKQVIIKQMDPRDHFRITEMTGMLLDKLYADADISVSSSVISFVILELESLR
jgi:U3 small nucleolar ribonucleoprotein protein IMP3